MFFKGTKKRPTTLEISSLIDGVGGEFNAFTSKEFTGYYIKASAKNIDLVLDVLSDILLNSKFDEEEIGRERGVIREELKMYLDTPMRQIGDLFEELLYGDQPLGWNTIGTYESLKNLNRINFSSYLGRFYQPSNIIVAVAGGVEEDKVHSVVERYLGAMPNKKAESYIPLSYEQEKPATKIFNKKTEQAHIFLGVRSYPRKHVNRYKVAVLNALVGASMSSRLFIELRERRGLAYYVRSGVDEYHDTGYFAAQAGVEISKVDEAIKVILNEFGRLTQEKVLGQELKKAKEYIKGKLTLGMEDSQEVASFFGLQELLEGKIRSPEEIMEEIDKVSADGVKSVAADIFKNNGLNLAIIGPYKDEGRFGKILKIG
jgi:predicted Zn-dependent peptidase